MKRLAKSKSVFSKDLEVTNLIELNFLKKKKSSFENLLESDVLQVDCQLFIGILLNILLKNDRPVDDGTLRCV